MHADSMIELFELSIPSRSLNALNRAGYRYVSDLKAVQADRLLGLPGFGERGLRELERELEPYGITFDPPTLMVSALVSALRSGPRTALGISRQVGFPSDEVSEGITILMDHGVVSPTFETGAGTYRLNPFFLRACDGRVA